MKITYTIFFVLSFISSTQLRAHNPYIDSLKNRLAAKKITSEEKYQLYATLIEKYRSDQEFSTALVYSSRLLKFAQQEKNFFQEAKAYSFTGLIYNNLKEFDTANKYLDSTTVSASKSSNPIADLYAQYIKAYQYFYFDEREKAMPYLVKILTVLEHTEKDYHLEYKVNYLVYSIYSDWDDVENSLKYANKCVEIATKSGNKNSLCYSYTALAVAYTNKIDFQQQHQYTQSAYDCSEKACRLYYDFPGQVSHYAYAIARNNYAGYLLEYSSKLTPELREKIEYNLNESLKVAKFVKEGGQQLQAGNYGVRSQLAMLDNDLKKAEEYLLKAKEVLLTQKPLYYPLMINVTNELSTVYEKQGNLKKALEYQKEAADYSAELFNQHQAETVSKLEAQYQSEKKERELQILSEKAENQKLQQSIYIGLGIAGTIVAFFIFRLYHYKLKYSRGREKQLNAEKTEAELQLKFEQEEQARLKAEQELLTMRQQKLQDEVMANQLHIQRKNQVLKDLESKLTEENNINIQQVIKEELHADSDFEDATFRIQEIHPNFFNRLNEHAVQKLTSLDLKYCAYLYLGMDTKQIAKQLNVEPKSVRMTKYRLKKKFGLNEENDLTAFISKITA